MKNAAEQANVVVCVGWEFYNVETIAPDYPEREVHLRSTTPRARRSPTC